MSKLIELAETVKAARTEIETLPPAEASRFYDRMAPLERRLSRCTPKTIPEAAALADAIVTWNEEDQALAETAIRRLAAGLARMATPAAGAADARHKN